MLFLFLLACFLSTANFFQIQATSWLNRQLQNTVYILHGQKSSYLLVWIRLTYSMEGWKLLCVITTPFLMTQLWVVFDCVFPRRVILLTTLFTMAAVLHSWSLLALLEVLHQILFALCLTLHTVILHLLLHLPLPARHLYHLPQYPVVIWLILVSNWSIKSK